MGYDNALSPCPASRLPQWDKNSMQGADSIRVCGGSGASTVDLLMGANLSKYRTSGTRHQRELGGLEDRRQAPQRPQVPPDLRGWQTPLCRTRVPAWVPLTPRGGRESNRRKPMVCVFARQRRLPTRKQPNPIWLWGLFSPDKSVGQQCAPSALLERKLKRKAVTIPSQRQGTGVGQALRGQGRRPDTSKLLAILAWEGHCASLGSSLETRFSSSIGLEPVTCILLRLN